MDSIGTRLRRSAASLLCLLPAALLAVLAIPHFLDGLALDEAIPVPTYMIAHRPMPQQAYRDAAAALDAADARDGEAAIAKAEASLRAGARPATQIPGLIAGLMQAPASARGWTLLAEAWMPTDRKKAAAALSQALVLAPNDYWLAGARALDAATLWNALDPDSQTLAVQQTRLLWEELLLRGQLRQLLASHEGTALVACAFVGRQDELRDMNRWLSAQRMHAPNVTRTSP